MRNSPPGMGRRSSGVIFEYRELQLAIVIVHAVEDHTDLVADRELAAGALPYDLANVLLISVLIAGQAVDRDQAFHVEVGQLDKEAVLGRADDEAVEILAYAAGHELYLLPLDQLALGVGGAALRLRTLLGDVAHFLFGERRSGMRLLQQRAQEAVNHQVGIAADGRREMRVRAGSQREVADIFDAVARLLE